MTRILIEALERQLNMPGPVSTGDVTVAYLASPSAAYTVVDGARLVFPAPVGVKIVDGQLAQQLDVDPTDERCYARITIQVLGQGGPRKLVRNVTIPDVDEVPFEDLVDVDPKTFEPLVPTPPSAQEILAQAAGAANAASSSAAASTEAAVDALAAKEGAEQAAASVIPSTDAAMTEVGSDPASAFALLQQAIIAMKAAAAVLAADIPGQVASEVASQPAVAAAATTAAATAVTNEIAGRKMIEQFVADPQAPWRWLFGFATGDGGLEGDFGRRLDGTFYPDFLNPSFADKNIVQLDQTQGWLLAVYFEGNDEVGFGIRTDGTLYPDSLNVASTVRQMRISGDSITAGWAGASATALGALLGMSVVVQGDGGRMSGWIAAKQGGQPLRITSSTGFIPASGAVAVTASFYNPLGSTAGLFVAGTLVGVLGGVYGTLTITDDVTGAGTFTRATPGREVPLPALTPLVRTLYRDAWCTAWPGRNNWKLTGDVDQIVRDVRDMFSFSNDKEHSLVFSILPWVGEETGTSIRNTLNAVNARLRDEFPTQFVDIAAGLRTQAILTAVGITPTATDIANIANGLTPESFRIDSGHLNAKGYEALNILVHDIYTARGWLS